MKDRLSDRFKELDVPLLVEFPHGEREALVFVIEPDAKSHRSKLRRLAVYCLQIADLLDTSRVVPVAIYPFRGKVAEDRLVLEGDFGKYLEFRCLSCSIGTLDAMTYSLSNNLVARMCLPLMRTDEAHRLEVISRAYEGLAALEPDQDRRAKYSQFISEYGELSQNEFQEMHRLYVDRNPYREAIMTMTEMFQGIGEVRGNAKLILKLYKDGILTADQAREQLLQIDTSGGPISKEIVDEALKALPPVQ